MFILGVLFGIMLWVPHAYHVMGRKAAKAYREGYEDGLELKKEVM